MKQKIVLKTSNNRNQIKTASSSKRNIVAENREIFLLKEIKKDIKEVKKFLSSRKSATLEKLTATKKKDVKITGLKIQEDKLFAQLDDGRELSIPIEWFAKWGIKGVNAKKLENYEIWEGEEIYFCDIDEVLGVEKFTEGFAAVCE